jgi:zinc finger CCHC domain-containing protein 9
MKNGEHPVYIRIFDPTLIVWPTDANGNNSPMLFGPAFDMNMGADEDDFHAFKRQTAQIGKEEKQQEKAKRTMDMKVGAHSGVVKAFGKPPVASTKKIVYF